MTPEEAINFMLNGGKCLRKNKKQIIIFKDGCFKIEDTGTVNGCFSNLEKIEEDEESDEEIERQMQLAEETQMYDEGN